MEVITVKNLDPKKLLIIGGILAAVLILIIAGLFIYKSKSGSSEGTEIAMEGKAPLLYQPEKRTLKYGDAKIKLSKDEHVFVDKNQAYVYNSVDKKLSVVANGKLAGIDTMELNPKSPTHITKADDQIIVFNDGKAHGINLNANQSDFIKNVKGLKDGVFVENKVYAITDSDISAEGLQQKQNVKGNQEVATVGEEIYVLNNFGKKENKNSLLVIDKRLVGKDLIELTGEDMKIVATTGNRIGFKDAKNNAFTFIDLQSKEIKDIQNIEAESYGVDLDAGTLTYVQGKNLITRNILDNSEIDNQPVDEGTVVLSIQ